MTGDRTAQRLADRFARQAATAVQRSSPLYQVLLQRCTADIVQGGPVLALLRDRADEPAGDALPLRLLAGVHQLVLSGQAPELASFYPSVGGDQPPAAAWPAFRRLVETSVTRLHQLLDRPLQTNEVRRCSALLLGLSRITHMTGLPVSVLEIGTSAGLNLNWYRYRYLRGQVSWGPADSEVCLELPPGVPDPRLALQPIGPPRGCDRAPLDVTDPGDRLWLRACIWADQTDRLQLLDAALAVAQHCPPVVESCDALAWLGPQLQHPRIGTTTVVVQTILQQYLNSHQRSALADTLAAAGAGATSSAPLAWLRVEPAAKAHRSPPDRRGLVEIRLRVWPGGIDQLLGHTGYHGHPVYPVMCKDVDDWRGDVPQ